MVGTLHIIALALYGAAAVVLAGSLARGQAEAPRPGATLVVTAVFVHAIALGAFTRTYGELPLVGLAPSLSMLAFLVGLFVLVSAALREARPLGVVLVPLIAVLVLVSLVRGIAPAAEPLAFRGFWFILHVVLTFAGYAALTVAFAAGLLYLLQFRQLKGRRFGRMYRFFPPLETASDWGRRALAIGFPALTLGLVIGTAWVLRFGATVAVGAEMGAKIALGVVTWLVFLGAIAGRSGGLAGDRRSAVISVVGFILVVATYVLFRVSVSAGRLFL